MLYGGVAFTLTSTLEPHTGKMGSLTEFLPTTAVKARLFERPFEKLKKDPKSSRLKCW